MKSEFYALENKSLRTTLPLAPNKLSVGDHLVRDGANDDTDENLSIFATVPNMVSRSELAYVDERLSGVLGLSRVKASVGRSMRSRSFGRDTWTW